MNYRALAYWQGRARQVDETDQQVCFQTVVCPLSRVPFFVDLLTKTPAHRARQSATRLALAALQTVSGLQMG
jgi:hypothetical protein